MNPLDMTGRRVLVTGASSGIGRATAVLLAQLGARLILVARDHQRLDSTLQQLAGSGHASEPFDLGQYDGIPPWIRDLADRHGALDGVAHCAGLQVTSTLRTLEVKPSETLWAVNVSAGLWLAKGFRQRGVNNAGGAVVFLSSVAGLAGIAALSAYSASKGALIALTRSLAVELAREKIRVNCVAPGMVKTEMLESATNQLSPEQLAALEAAYPFGFGEAVDVAQAVAYLLSRAAKWVTGTTLVIDGGYTAR